MNTRLDIHANLPSGMAEYLSTYGWHFSKKMAEWAISKMTDRTGARVKPKDKTELHEQMKAQGIDVKNIEGYDAVYVEAMARSDFYGSGIASESQLLKFVGDYLNDKDGYEGVALTRFNADCIGSGIPIYWEDML